MSSNAAKKLRRMRQKRGGWKRNDVYSVYEGFGFIIKGGGSHDRVYHSEFKQIVRRVPRHNDIGEYVIDELIKAIDELNRLRSQKEKAEKEAENKQGDNPDDE
jgi:hypothetical protein